MELRETTEQQRTPYYSDIRELLNPGFIAHPVDVNGTSVLLRSLGPGDFFLLRHRAATSLKNKTWKNWTLAMAIWMIDGQILLGDQSNIYRLYQMCQAIPKNVRDDMFSVFTGLMNRVDISLKRMESYLYETESRYIWKSEGTRMFEAGVIPGIPKLGMNPVQKLWTFFNDLEDDQDTKRHDWATAKFLMSAHAPKGIKKLNASDDKHAQTEKVRRQRVLDLMFYQAEGLVLDEEGNSLVGPIHSLQTVNTVEEMEAEMRSWVEGNRDFHDEVVLTTKASIRRKHDDADADQIRRIEEIRAAMDEEGIVEPSFSPVMGEAREAAARRIQQKTPTRVFSDNTHNSAYDKYIKEDAEVGALAVRGDQMYVRNPGQIPHEAILEAMTKPEAKDAEDTETRKLSLDEQVKKRGKPVLRFPGDE